MNNDEIKNLEAVLRDFSKSDFGDFGGERIKEKLFTRIIAEESLVKDLNLMALDAVPQASKRALIKEKVFEKIAVNVWNRFSWRGIFLFHRKLFGGVLVLVMFFFLVLNVSPGDNLVSASEISVVNAFEGEVWVYRNGEKNLVSVGFELKEGDKVMTAENGSVEIYFFDYTAARLAPNSKLNVNRLSNWRDSVGTYVEVSLENGRVWSKVANLVEEKSEFVVEASGKKVSTAKGAFDIEVVDKRMYVGVFNDSVAVSNNAGKVEKVISGQKIMLEDDVVLKKQISNEEREMVWVKDNLKIDHEYLNAAEKRLIIAKIKALGKDVNDSNFSLEDSIDDVKLVLLDFDDVERQKELLGFAEKKVLAFQARFAEGEDVVKELKQAILDFQSQVEEFYALIEEVKLTDKKFAEDLLKYLSARVGSYKKELAVTNLTSPNYDLKKLVNDFELKMITDPVEVIEAKVSQVEGKLYDVNAIKGFADVKMVNDATTSYFKDVKDVVEEIEGIEDETLKVKLLDEVLDDFTIFEEMSGAGADSFELKVDKSGKILPPLL